MIIREVERPYFKDLFSWIVPHFRVKPEILDKIQLVGSGKGAIALVFRYLTEKKIISNKLDEVLVPDWLGYWVYNQMHPFIFPTKNFSSRTKILFVYHQYGFPQDMDKILEFAKDKKLVVIEDCAHALASYYKGKSLGSFGDFAIYSFSKWFFCFALGGVCSKFADFYGYAEKALVESPLGLTSLKDAAKFLYERSTFSTIFPMPRFSNLFVKMTYAVYGEALRSSRLGRYLLYAKIENEITARRKRYLEFLEQAGHLGICDHLEKEDVTPYVIPILIPESKNKNLVQALRERGIWSGVYHFDINRNLLSPKFVPCVLIPCHSGISNDNFEVIIKTVKKTL